jgi:hypothetical protein
MRIKTHVCGSALLVACLLASGCGSSTGGNVERTLEDPAGDVAAATAPDVVAVGVERDDESIRFNVRFADAPPLGMSEEEGWVDMLLIGIDLPPLGSPPTMPGGEWRGADFALGTHGPSETGALVRFVTDAAENEATSERQADVPLETDGAVLSLLVPREALGDPETLVLSIAAAREWKDADDERAGGTPDIVPDTGTWTVDLAE